MVDCCDSAVGVGIENYVFSNALDGYFLYQIGFVGLPVFRKPLLA